MMKKLFLFLLFVPTLVFALPTARQEMDVFPQRTDTYYLGTTTLRWLELNAKNGNFLTLNINGLAATSTNLWYPNGNNIYNANTGQVGIGIVSTAAKLDIQTNSTNGLFVRSSAAHASSAGAGIVGYSDSGAALSKGDRCGFYLLGGAEDSIHTLTNSVGFQCFASENWSSGNAGADMSFTVQPNGTDSTGTRIEPMRFLNNGQITIGTSTAPDLTSMLTVSDTTGGVVTLWRNDTTVSTNDNLGTLSFGGRDADLTTQKVFGNIQVTSFQSVSTDAAAGNMIFRTSSTTVAGSPVEAMRISPFANVGIGATAPPSALTVSRLVDASQQTTTGSLTGTLNTQLHLAYPASTNGAGVGLSFSVTASGGPVGAKIVHIRTSTNSVGDLAFFTRSDNSTVEADLTTEKMRIMSNGRVGVGTTSPFGKFAINAVGGDTNILIFNVASSTAAFATTSLFSVDRNGLATALNFLATSSTTLQNFTFVNATGTSATTTNFFSTTASSTNLFTTKLGVGTSTPVAIIDSFTSASTTNLLLEATSGKGGCLIMKDVQGTGYTQVYAQAGSLFSKVSTSLTTCN